MKFRTQGPMRGDATARYSVIEYEAKTVRELINEILTSYHNEWGYIGIGDKNSFFVHGFPYCEYSHRRLLSSMPEDILDKEIESVSASGGWSRMDYLITLKK